VKKKYLAFCLFNIQIRSVQHGHDESSQRVHEKSNHWLHRRLIRIRSSLHRRCHVRSIPQARHPILVTLYFHRLWTAFFKVINRNQNLLIYKQAVCQKAVQSADRHQAEDKKQPGKSDGDRGDRGDSHRHHEYWSRW
jgi:hypothetical protein